MTALRLTMNKFCRKDFFPKDFTRRKFYERKKSHVGQFAKF